MKFLGRFQEISTSQKFLVLLVCILIGALLTGVLMLSILTLSGHAPDAITSGSAPIGLLKILQLISTIGMLGIPGLLAVMLFNYRDVEQHIYVAPLLLVVLFAISVLPTNEWLGVWNHQLSLPDWLSGLEDWIRQSEANAAELIQQFLAMGSIDDLVFNLFLIALAPAVCEELLFRGALQRIMHERFNMHVAILISAAIFSAFHMQFLGFVPRFVLGVALGYLYAWSGKLIYPILAHFTNNAVLVILVYVMGADILQEDASLTTFSPFLVVPFSLVISGVTLYAFYRLTEKRV